MSHMDRVTHRREIVNTERVRMSILELERVQDEELPFDMEVWVESCVPSPLDCSTAACAAGWICRAQWARDAGLCLVEHTDRFGHQPVFDHSCDYDAMAKFLGVGRRAAVWLFSPSYYSEPVEYRDEYTSEYDRRDVSAWEVAARMRLLLRCGESCVPPPGSPEVLWCDRDTLALVGRPAL